MSKSTRKTAFVLIALMSLAIACGGTSISTWRAQLSYAPTPSPSSPLKAAFEQEYLGISVCNGVEVSVSEDNTWSAIDSKGVSLSISLLPPSRPNMLEATDDGFAAHCAEGVFTYRLTAWGFIASE